MNRTTITRWLVAPLALAAAVTLAAVPTAQASPAACRISLIAHRGHHAGDYTENTMWAFRAAVRTGAQAVETDLRTTVDDEIVLMHDRTLGRTTRERGIVSRMTGAEVHSVRANDGQRVPFLIGMMRFLRNRPNIKGVLQLKSITPKSVRLLRRRMVEERVMRQVTVSSTHLTDLRLAKRVMPNVRRKRIAQHPPVPRRLARVADSVVLPMRLLSDDRVALLRRAGLKVYAKEPDHRRPKKVPPAEIGLRAVSTNNVPRFVRHCSRVADRRARQAAEAAQRERLRALEEASRSVLVSALRLPALVSSEAPVTWRSRATGIEADRRLDISGTTFPPLVAVVSFARVVTGANLPHGSGP